MKNWKHFLKNPVLIGLVLSLALTAPLVGGNKKKVHVIQLPEVAADGSVPKAARTNEYIFFDKHSSSLLLAYPPDLTDENFEENKGKKSEFSRVILSIGISPDVRTRIFLSKQGLDHRYEFEVENEPQAKMSIGKLSMELSSLDQITSQIDPRGWNCDKTEMPEEWTDNKLSVMNMIPGTIPFTADQIIYRRANWWCLNEKALISPGSSNTFVVESDHLPGLTQIYFQGAPYKPRVDGSVPSPVRHLIPAFNFIETNSVSLPVIGPAINPSLFKETRICMLLNSIVEFTDKDLLQVTPFTNAASLLAKDCLSRASAELESDIQEMESLIGDSFERELFDALIINLMAN